MMTTKDLSYTTGDQCPNKGHTAIWDNIPQMMDNPKLASVTNILLLVKQMHQLPTHEEV